VTRRVPDEETRGGALPGQGSVAGPAREGPTAGEPAAPPAAGGPWVVGSFVVGTLLVSWFFVAWLWLQRPAAEAAGDSVGSAFALLLVVSVIGAFRSRAR
jgi:hypothetical protein